MSAGQGNPLGQFNLASCYFGGIGVPRDQKEALRLYRLVADQEGNPHEKSRLGRIYFFGNGVKKDMVLAMSYFARAGRINKKFLESNLFFYHPPEGVTFEFSVDRSTKTSLTDDEAADRIIEIIDVLGKDADIASKRIAKNESTLIADLVHVSPLSNKNLIRIIKRLETVPGMDVVNNASFQEIAKKTSIVSSNPLVEAGVPSSSSAINSLAAVGAVLDPERARPPASVSSGCSAATNPLASLSSGAGKAK